MKFKASRFKRELARVSALLTPAPNNTLAPWLLLSDYIIIISTLLFSGSSSLTTGVQARRCIKERLK